MWRKDWTTAEIPLFVWLFPVSNRPPFPIGRTSCSISHYSLATSLSLRNLPRVFDFTRISTSNFDSSGMEAKNPGWNLKFEMYLLCQSKNEKDALDWYQCEIYDFAILVSSKWYSILCGPSLLDMITYSLTYASLAKFPYSARFLSFLLFKNTDSLKRKKENVGKLNYRRHHQVTI